MSWKNLSSRVAAAEHRRRAFARRRTRLPGWNLPEPLRGDRRPFDHRMQLLKGNVGIELAVTGKGAEPAIAAGDHPLAADDVGKAAKALGDELRAFAVIRRGV